MRLDDAVCINRGDEGGVWARSCFLHGLKSGRMCQEQTRHTDRSLLAVLCEARILASGQVLTASLTS